MKHYFCLIASIVLASCVVIPVPAERTVIDGRRFTDSDLDFVQSGTTARPEVIGNLGSPTLWLPEQRLLVYGLRQVETGTLWFVGAGLSGTGGLVEGETREALYLVLDDEDIVRCWGRAPVSRGETWLSAATEWTASRAIDIPQARDRFVEETPTTEQSLIYFYRPRDYLHFLPLVPPAKKALPGVASYADIRQHGALVGQIRWRSYVIVRVPPGAYTFVVDPDTDDVANPEKYRSAAIRLDVAPETATFVDVGIQAGRGIIEPVIVERPHREAISAIEELRESW